ncbi:MAG: hypothetical protein KGY75_01865 [Candidatus Cloacimonetes bacterium]|nr:hypothetical protein [Candidatus Cloacimonadota bacterium]MBS3766858.1 hypothetical protein [Candidatus Cloacimonadota bacterium]
MTLKEKVFKWFDEHPEELEKTGYGSNAKLREAFPNESRKTLSMYKMQYKNLEEMKQMEEGKESAEESKEKEKDTIEDRKVHKCNLNFSKDFFLLAIPVVLFLLWLIIKPHKK